jgi:hypothetical protein
VDQTFSTDYLFASGFDFSSLPQNIRIDGIVVLIEKSVGVIGSGDVVDNVVRLYLGGAMGTNLANPSQWMSTTDFIQTYGSSSNLWGVDLTRAIVTNAGFGVVLSTTGLDADPKQGRVDHISMTVHYTNLLYPFWHFKQ